MPAPQERPLKTTQQPRFQGPLLLGPVATRGGRVREDPRSEVVNM